MTTFESFTGAPPALDIPRDRWGRPLIKPKGGGKAVGYTRASSLGKTLEDETTLTAWKLRQVVIGMASRPDLVALAAAKKNNTKELNKVATDAKEYALASAAANTGTAVHGFIEALAKGEEVGPVPASLQADVAAYQAAMAEWETVSAETFVVCDELKVAGTFDILGRRPRRLRGGLVIMDLKGLALDTEIPTPAGWTTMDAIQPGDLVFGRDGRPYPVTAKSEVKRIGTYVVRFDDGSTVVCDREHLWLTLSGINSLREEILGIEEIASSLRVGKQPMHRVPAAAALQLPDADLPVDPYLLGCWLGDGSARAGQITKGRDLFEILEADGHALGAEQANHSPVVLTRTVHGLTKHLRALNVLHNKHIPDAYLRASEAQRWRLLQGLFDTDGSWNVPRKRAVFSSCDKALALGVEELVASLGLIPHTATSHPSGFGKTVASHVVDFRPPVGCQPFRLPRKAARVVWTESPRNTRRVIQSVTPGPDVETACIAVASPDRTYLCGRRMIPTHNTGANAVKYGQGEIAVQLAIYAHGEKYDPATGAREPLDCSLTDGYVIHLPVGSGKADIYRVDLEKGWYAAKLAVEVREWRKVKGLFTQVEEIALVDIGKAVAKASTIDEVRAAYSTLVRAGNDKVEVEAACRARIAELGEAAT